MLNNFTSLLLFVTWFLSLKTGRAFSIEYPKTSYKARKKTFLLATANQNVPSPLYEKVFVAGGSKGVGRMVIENIVQKGSSVVALVRNADTASELSALEGVTLIEGNAFDYKTVENAMDGCDAAVSTLGGSLQDNGKIIDYDGNQNVIEAAGILGVTRLVLVTSIGCGTSKEAAPPLVLEILKDALAAKEKAENILIKYYTNMNWSIIRPGGLTWAPATGQAILTKDNSAVGTIHREDLADLIVQVLFSDKCERLVLSALDNASEEGTDAEEFSLNEIYVQS